jgi:capsular polysaccharide biosynthesis protein
MRHPIQKNARFILFSGIIFAVIALLVSFLFPLEYRADAQVLIISKSRYGVDPYTVVKSAERVGENMLQVMKTSDFMNKTRAQEGFFIDWSRFDDLSERRRRKLWQKSVKGSVVFGTGVLNVSAYSTNKLQAQYLAAAASSALVSRGWEYVGGDVTIKVVNNPVVSKWPVRPNLLLNTFIGFVLGILIMIYFVLKK